ncbi:hypothetical protein OCAR_5766 [Afipia carboxidovorans OM5]|nr:hypothetical protein OCAR_5766 [Afipia carboxidovorans OM5]
MQGLFKALRKSRHSLPLWPPPFWPFEYPSVVSFVVSHDVFRNSSEWCRMRSTSERLSSVSRSERYCLA